MKEKINHLSKEDKELIALLEKDVEKLKKSPKKEPWSIEVVCTNEDIKKSFERKSR